MATATRRAEVVWQGDLIHGSGDLSSGTGAFGPLPVTWASRTERPDGKTSPEELMAAAQAACYAMALSHTLAQQGTPPERLDVSAACTFDFGAGKITTMEITVKGKVPGLDAQGFKQAAAAGEQGCPVSNALRGNVQISVNAELE